MPRKLKSVVIDVNSHRAENYEYHFQCRQFGKSHPLRDEIAGLVGKLAKPTLNLYGVTCGVFGTRPTDAEFEYYKLAGRLKLEDAGILLWWYWSDAGWASFQELWQALPDSVHTPLCTTDRVVHIRTQDVYENATPGD